MSQYRKLIAATIGLLLIVGRQFFGLNVDEANADTIIDAILGLATLVGVERFANATKP